MAFIAPDNFRKVHLLMSKPLRGFGGSLLCPPTGGANPYLSQGWVRTQPSPPPSKGWRGFEPNPQGGWNPPALTAATAATSWPSDAVVTADSGAALRPLTVKVAGALGVETTAGQHSHQLAFTCRRLRSHGHNQLAKRCCCWVEGGGLGLGSNFPSTLGGEEGVVGKLGSSPLNILGEGRRQGVCFPVGGLRWRGGWVHPWRV